MSVADSVHVNGGNSQQAGNADGAETRTLASTRELIRVARGLAPADLVLRNGQLVNVFTNEIYPADVAVVGGRIAGIGSRGAYGGRREVDVGGHYLTPGLVEAHTHIESSLLTPGEFARA